MNIYTLPGDRTPGSSFGDKGIESRDCPDFNINDEVLGPCINDHFTILSYSYTKTLKTHCSAKNVYQSLSVINAVYSTFCKFFNMDFLEKKKKGKKRSICSFYFK